MIQAVLPERMKRLLLRYFSAHGLKRYGTNTIWALVARTFSLGVSFFVSVYLTRYLGAENYGQLSYAVSFVGLFVIISSLGIDNILYRDIVAHPERRDEYLGTALIIKLIMGAVTAAIVAVAAYIVVHDDVSRIIIFMLAGTYIFVPFQIIITDYQAHVAQKYPSIVSLFVVCVLNALKLAVIFSGKGILYVAAILLLEPIIYAILYILLRTYHYGSILKWKYTHSVAIGLIKDSWPFVFIVAFSSIYMRIDQVMLKHLINAEAVGYYDAAVRIAEAWLFLPSIIASSMFPAIVNARLKDAKEYRKRILALLLLIGSISIIVAVAVSLLSEYIMTFLYGASFAVGAGVLAVYMLGSIFAALDSPVRLYLIAENRRRTIFFLTSGTAILNIVLNFILIPRLGMIGAAWATFISYAILLLPILPLLKNKV